LEKTGEQLLELYGNRVRLRVCGICTDGDKILLVGHSLPGHFETFWSPPGGGQQFGETSRDTLKREFLEETGLRVDVGEMLFVNEFIEPPLHAIELFFRINSFEGKLITGKDPEFSDDNQIIGETRFMSIDEILTLPEVSRHGILKNIQSVTEILHLSGFLSEC